MNGNIKEDGEYIAVFVGCVYYCGWSFSWLATLSSWRTHDLDPIIYQIFKNVQKVGNEFDKINNEKYIDFKPCKKKWIKCRETLNIGSPFEKLYKSLYIIKHSYQKYWIDYQH